MDVMSYFREVLLEILRFLKCRMYVFKGALTIELWRTTDLLGEVVIWASVTNIWVMFGQGMES